MLPLISKPFVVFKHVLFKDIKLYFKSFLKQLFTLILAGAFVFLIISFIKVPVFVQVIVNFLISLIIPTLIIILVYRKTDEFNSAKSRIVFLFNKIRKRA